MNKDSINRLLHTLVPFMVMTMVQRLLLLIFGHIGFTGELAELLAFVPAAGAAVLLFCVKTYHIYKEDEQNEIAPLKTKSAFLSALRTVLTVAVMIVLMYATAAFLNGMSFSSAGYVESSPIAVISTLIIHPLVEEYLFRKLFYGELRLLNPIFGCMMQAVMFAIIHNSVDSMIYALVSGVTLAVVYEQTGTIWSSITAHFAINLRSFLYLTVLKDHSGIAQTVDMAVIILGGVAFLVIGVIEGRRIAAYNEDESIQAPDEAGEAADDE